MENLFSLSAIVGTDDSALALLTSAATQPAAPEPAMIARAIENGPYAPTESAKAFSVSAEVIRASQSTRITLAEAREVINGLGMTIRKTDGEYRVAFRDGTAAERESSAYYTSDISDAIGTARAMASKKAEEQRKARGARMNFAHIIA